MVTLDENARHGSSSSRSNDNHLDDKADQGGPPPKKKTRLSTDEQKKDQEESRLSEGRTKQQYPLPHIQFPRRKENMYPGLGPGPDTLDKNWEYWRILSEEMYSVFSRHREFNGEYLSLMILGEGFYESILDKSFEASMSVLAVEVTKVSEMFLYGANQKRLLLQATDFRTASNSRNMNPLRRKICAHGSLADLLVSTVKVGDVLVVICRTDFIGAELTILNAPVWVPESEDNKVTIAHYRHEGIFSLNSDIQNSDCSSIKMLLKDPQFESETHEISDTESRVMFRPSTNAKAVVEAYGRDQDSDVVLTEDVVNVVAKEIQLGKDNKADKSSENQIRRSLGENKNSDTSSPSHRPASTNPEGDRDSHDHHPKHPQAQPSSRKIAPISNDKLAHAPLHLFEQSSYYSTPSEAGKSKDDIDVGSGSGCVLLDSIMTDLRSQGDNDNIHSDNSEDLQIDIGRTSTPLNPTAPENSLDLEHNCGDVDKKNCDDDEEKSGLESQGSTNDENNPTILDPKTKTLSGGIRTDPPGPTKTFESSFFIRNRSPRKSPKSKNNDTPLIENLLGKQINKSVHLIPSGIARVNTVTSEKKASTSTSPVKVNNTTAAGPNSEIQSSILQDLMSQEPEIDYNNELEVAGGVSALRSVKKAHRSTSLVKVNNHNTTVAMATPNSETQSSILQDLMTQEPEIDDNDELDSELEVPTGGKQPNTENSQITEHHTPCEDKTGNGGDQDVEDKLSEDHSGTFDWNNMTPSTQEFFVGNDDVVIKIGKDTDANVHVKDTNKQTENINGNLGVETVHSHLGLANVSDEGGSSSDNNDSVLPVLRLGKTGKKKHQDRSSCAGW